MKNSQKNVIKKGKLEMATKEKNTWILILFILAGLVIGGLIGQLASGVNWLSWISYGQQFGLESPIVLDLNVIKLTFGLMFNINIASIIGMAISIIIYKKFM